MAGYFDGDGSVIVKVRRYVAIFYLEFCDNSKEQLEQVSHFLAKNANISSRIYNDVKMGACLLMVTRQDSVVAMSRRMLRYSFKKRKELHAVVDYYTGRITGDEAIRIFNSEVQEGVRIGRLWRATLPLDHSSGVRLGRRRSKLTDAQIEVIRRKHADGISTTELSLAYRKAMSTIRKVLID